MNLNAVDAAATYTSVDLNSSGTTDLYDPPGDATVYGIYLKNGGSNADVDVEVTDGSSTATLAQSGAGNSVEFGDTIVLDANDKLQTNVQTVEGSSQTNTAVVLKSE